MPAPPPPSLSKNNAKCTLRQNLANVRAPRDHFVLCFDRDGGGAGILSGVCGPTIPVKNLYQVHIVAKYEIMRGPPAITLYCILTGMAGGLAYCLVASVAHLASVLVPSGCPSNGDPWLCRDSGATYVVGGRVGVSETACGRGGCLDPSPYPLPWTWTGPVASGQSVQDGPRWLQEGLRESKIASKMAQDSAS